MAKLPGKTAYSGRRRTTERTSGFNSHSESTGGEYKEEKADVISLRRGQKLVVIFEIPTPKHGFYLGYGGYYKCEQGVTVTITNPNFDKNTCHRFPPPDWSKFGSLWKSEQKAEKVEISFYSEVDTTISIYGLNCGLVWSEHFDGAREGIMRNMHSLSPEGNTYVELGNVIVFFPDESMPDENELIPLKSCNRCARFLPINLNNERNHLSFSNHCVSRAPCSHSGFGRLTNVDTGEEMTLYHGYQLECRFCKKYVVNAPLNPQRTAAQMKEDGQRRRNFELLLTELYQMSPQLSYRHNTGRELPDDIWEKFNRSCFNCDEPLKSPRKMHLDHTRPLALLWPLDETATALCPTCNSQKRDRYPSEFYSENKIIDLAGITNLGISDLKSPEPNHPAITALLSRLDWLYDEFLVRPDLLKERDGKVTAELVVKALDKALARSKVNYNFSFVSEYNTRRDADIVFDDNEDVSDIV